MNLNKLQNNTKVNESGFSLIETIIAIFILVIAVTGPLAAASSSLKASFYARDQVVAFYLAQDVIESIKNYRDNIYMENFANNDTVNWLENTINFNPGNEVSIDTSPISGGLDIIVDQSSPETQIFLDETNNFFGHNPDDTPTKYKRYVEFEKVNNHGSKNNELKIIVTVEWQPRFILGDTKKIVVQENIYNWLEFE